MAGAWDRLGQTPQNDHDPTHVLDFEGGINEQAQQSGNPINNALTGLANALGITSLLDLIDGVQDGTFDPSAAAARFFAVLLTPLTWFINLTALLGIDLNDEDADTTPTGPVFGGLLGWAGAFYNALTGQAQTGVTVTQAAQQAAALADNQVAQAAALAAIQAALTGGGNSGVVGGDDFERVNPTDLGTGWTIIRTGGAHTLGIVNGHDAAMIESGTAQTEILAVRADPADRQTTTRYQQITMVEGSQVIVSPFGGGSDAQNSMLGRVGPNLITPTAWVRPEFAAIGSQWVIRLLYAVGGVETALPIGPGGATYVVIPVRAAGTIWQFQCGTTVDEFNYRIVRAGQIAVNYLDSGHVTQSSDNHRGWGFGLGGGQFTPSSITRVVVADNAPAEIAGTYGRISRVNTAAVSFSTTGGAVYPASFHDTIDGHSADVSANLAAGSFTIATPGPLHIEVGLKCGLFGLAGTGTPPIVLQVYVDGLVVEENAEMAGVWTQQVSTNAVSQSDSIIFRTTISIAAGETVSFGYKFPAARSCVGTIDGLRSYAKVSR